uniref:Guanylate kinase-like domain-containing protein n=1 Tax=Ditylenchus dipsaci TaxID=166011 RepID=A0A915EF48_9BILA
MCGEAVVMKVGQEVAKMIHPGDTILEVNGRPVHSKKQLYSIVQKDGDSTSTTATLKLVLSDIYTAPMEFCKVLEDHTSNELTTSELENEGRTQTGALPYLSFSIKKGDVLQVLSTDKSYMQARKVNDLSKAGFVPSNIKVERVAMLSPYGRRVLVLLGAAGVGRRTLKAMLLEQLPIHFSTVVPLTSRATKPTEQEGREYHFKTKEDILKRIRNGQMIEWGEHNDQLYGTSADSVRSVIRSGRVEFMPYVVVLTAPHHDELVQMAELRAKLDPAGTQVDPKRLKETCEQSERLLQSDYAKYFHLVLVNRNRDVTLRRLLDALDHLKNESQWIPADWLS